MKTAPWKTLAAVFFACPVLVVAQSAVMPKKFQNASPEVRAAAGYPPVLEQDTPSFDLDDMRVMARADPPYCASVKASGPVKFRGRTLTETPDISEPDLRLANELMSAGCFTRAVDKLAAVTGKDPGNKNAKFVIARMTWFLTNDADAAERVLNEALAERSDFVSAKVLLAAIRFDDPKLKPPQRLTEVARILDEIEPRSPTDLWIFLDRLRLEALRSPSRDLRVRLLEIVRNTAFPRNAREEAGDIAKLLPNPTTHEYEEILWAKYGIDSSSDLPCKAHELAEWIGDEEGRYADVIKLLESPRAKAGNCSGLEANRTVLAVAYLMEAAKLSAGPSPENRRLLDHVDQILNGDYTSLARYMFGRPQVAAKLQPFITPNVNPDEEDSTGATVICNAIMQFDVDLVRAQLDAGADPNGQCGDESLVGSIVYMATTKKPQQRAAMLKMLMEHGAKPTRIDACRNPDDGDCAKVLRPVMEPYYRPGVGGGK